uniref:SAM domain-containing protein n=1 Tax=Vombatus ursinus TaxID=29139 RepID=A0A4X2LNA7_VOMUR
MASDASHMLEAALEQMDGIIAGTKSAAEHSNGAYDVGLPSQSPYMNMFPVLHLVEDLKLSLEMLGDPQEREALRGQIPEPTAAYIKEWLQGNLSQVNHPAAVTNETYQERLARLEGDKESLMLQVSVLTDQVEVQGEKIRDLEICLEGHQVKLNAAEEMLQQELLSRTSLEAQKLELTAEVSELKLRLVGMEREQREQEEKQRKAELVVNLISDLQEQMCRLQLEISSQIQERMLQDRDHMDECSPQESPQASNPDGLPELLQELKHLKIKVEELESERNQYEWKLKATKAEIAQLQERLALKDAEMERLHSQLSRTVACAESTERDQEVQRLKIGMETLLVANEEKDRRIEELTLLLSQYRRVKEIMLGGHGSSERILSSGEEEMEGSFRKWNVVNKSPGETMKLEVSPRCASPTLGAPPLPQKTLETSGSILDTSNGQISHCEEDSLESQSRTQEKLFNSLEDLQSSSVEKCVDGKPLAPVVGAEDTLFLGENKYQTLPGKLPGTTHNGEPGTSIPPTSQTSGSSLPSLRETESNLDNTVTSNDLSPTSSGTDSGPQSPLTPEMKRSPKGIRKFWGKIRRTQSGNFNTDAIGIAEFRRGGLRATAGPRLSRTRDPKAQKSDSNAPFAQWNTEQVCSWLEDFGLGQYVIFARQWVSSGHTLLTATPQDMEKELGIKHPLHRKKLVLAVKSINTKQEEKSAQLDHIWVTRWLDDIGLPQYKDQFHESRVDGRMLQYLTVNDLLFLKVTSQLHHLSIKCAIHVLHVNKFNPHCLHRRPADESNVSPSEVVQWSNHRVMEWLRSVDLAEYAPNLRGSGVHGGLIPKKLGFSHFGNMRKKKFDESTDYICPTEPCESVNGNHKAYGSHSHRGLPPSPGEELDKLDQMEPSEGTVLQIGVISQDIHNLTTVLNQDGLLK